MSEKQQAGGQQAISDRWALIWWFEGDARVELYDAEEEARKDFEERAQTGWRAGIFELKEPANWDKWS